jgi:predicted esterase
MEGWGRVAREDLFMQCVLGWRWTLAAVLLAALAQIVGLGNSARGADVVTLKNGMTLEGTFGNLGAIGPNALAPVGGGGVQLKRIVLCDDQLRRTFVFSGNLAGPFAPSPITRFEKFTIKQRECLAGRGFASIAPIRWTPFDEHGRRIFSINTNEGPVDVVQGITEVTPTYTRLAVLQGNKGFVWSMAVSTNSIAREDLSKILRNYIDVKNADDRLKIVRLYIQSERIQDARAELETVIKDFPGLAALNATAKELTQMSATRLIKEIELRRDAGQPLLAMSMLEKFPSEGVAGDTLIKVRELLGEFNEVVLQGQAIVQSLDQNLAAVKDAKVRDELAPIIAEIKGELNIHNLARLADYLRLSTDAALSAEQKLSLAISGWLLGRDSGLDNLLVSKSLVQVRELVRQYLRSKLAAERAAILSQMSSLEGATPEYIAKIVAHMRPPLEPAPATAEVADPGDVKAAIGPPAPGAVNAAPVALPAAAVPAPPEPMPPPAAEEPAPAAKAKPAKAAEKKGLDGLFDEPKAAAPRRDPAVVPAAKEEPAPPEARPVVGATDVPGLFRLTVAGLPEDPQIEYWVQLPPEYSPYRRYPCIVTLNGGATTPQQQIDWWAGDYKADTSMRYGQAARHGYIVISPRWLREHQREYEYSAREHAAVLRPLRDAGRRFSIDTDRVYLSGHSLGGDAAWDIGLAHPDLWAGVIPIVAKSDKHVQRYWENAQYVPMYFVSGEKDGDKLEKNAQDWNRYLARTGNDVMVVQFQGRGHEHYHEEIQNLFKWMNLHKRDFFQRDIDVVSMRPWDSFFWWIDIDRMPENLTILPSEWPKKDVKTPRIEAQVLSTGTGVRVTSPSAKTTVWLAPEIVNFAGKVTATINGRAQRNISPSIGVLLEDVRTRGDRLHPFWAKVESQ